MTFDKQSNGRRIVILTTAYCQGNLSTGCGGGGIIVLKLRRWWLCGGLRDALMMMSMMTISMRMLRQLVTTTGPAAVGAVARIATHHQRPDQLAVFGFVSTSCQHRTAYDDAALYTVAYRYVVNTTGHARVSVQWRLPTASGCHTLHGSVIFLNNPGSRQVVGASRN